MERTHLEDIRQSELEKVNADLRTANAELQKINSFLNSIVENLPDMIFVKEATTLKFERFNTAGERLLGRSRSELIGKNDYDFFPREQAEFFIEKDQEVLSQKKPLDIPEEVIDTPHGARLLHTKKIPILDEQGQPRYLLGISEDITERRRTEAELWALNQVLERRVAERTAAAEDRAHELALSNQELERFAYVASHDLQEPLRTITSYVQLLERRYNNQLDPEAHEFIRFAVDGAQRMRALINGLLEYSRVGQQGQAPCRTDVTMVLHQTLVSLKMALDKSQAIITSDALPVVLFDPVLLSHVLQNLIGNAIKFCKKKPPRVHVSAREVAGQWHFSVQDNGIGIDPQHNVRIFEIFHRLHSSDAYPGTGLGLAISKKIMEKQGGTIWVESEPDKGSTFYFSVPALTPENSPIVNKLQ